MSNKSREIPDITPGALTLVLEAAEGRLQIVLGRTHPERDMEPLAAQSWAARSQGAELLAPALRDMLNRLGLAPAHMGRVAAVTGPGSFTGLRLCCVTCSALSRALNIPQAGLEYLPLLASGLSGVIRASAGNGATVLAITHARRNLVYMQKFQVAAAGAAYAEAEPCGPLDALTLPQSIEAIKSAAASGPVYAVGSGLSRNMAAYADVLGQLGGTVFTLPERFNRPDPSVLLQAAANAEYTDADLAPLYLRPSDAEENLDHVSALLGLNVEASRIRLEELLDSPPDQES